MTPLKGEFLLQIPPLPPQDPQKNSGFSLEHHRHRSSKKRPRRSKSEDAAAEEEEDVERGDEFRQRKIIHRDIERHRRQEMTGLYSSLRSLLPVEYIRGKRSISDHMCEAVKYIKNTEKRIEELCRRRDHLKKLRSSAQQQSARKDAAAPFSVNVSNCGAGVEAIICCGLGIPLSGILIELIGAGLSVVSSVSTRIEEKFVHRIQAEATDKDAAASSSQSFPVDTETLQRRLEKVLTFG